MSSKKENKSPKYYLQYAGLSLQMVAIMGLATWLGRILDQHCRLDFPWFLSILSVSATVLSIYLTVKELLNHTKGNKNVA